MRDVRLLQAYKGFEETDINHKPGSRNLGGEQMADNKKYYYLKLKEDFFDSDEMLLLQGMKDGYLYSDILMKMYLRSLKNEGRLMYKDYIPYSLEMISTITRHQVGTVPSRVIRVVPCPSSICCRSCMMGTAAGFAACGRISLASTFAVFGTGRAKVDDVYQGSCPFQWGKGTVLREGRDVTIIATGLMVQQALIAADTLAAQGKQAMVINMAAIKPLDEDLVVAAAKQTGFVVTAEEHSVIGGLGSAVAETLSRRHPTRQAYVGIDDCFGESGKAGELLQKYGLTAEAIVKACLLA